MEDREYVEAASLLGVFKRWHTFPRMLYRPSLAQHHYKVALLAQALMPDLRGTFPKEFSNGGAERTFYMALNHDLPELHPLTGGDLPSYDKDMMSEDGKRELEEANRSAIADFNSMFYPEQFGGYPPYDLILEANEKSTIPSQATSYLDKVDGFNENFHELLAGNRAMLRNEKNPDNVPAMHYINTKFKPRKLVFPLLDPLFVRNRESTQKNGLLEIPQFTLGDLEEIIAQGKPHTPDSILKETGIPIYDAWKEAILYYNGKVNDEIVELLTRQQPDYHHVEFPTLTVG